MTRCFLLQCLDWIRWERLDGLLHIALRTPHLQLLFWYAHILKFYASSSWSWSSNDISKIWKNYCSVCHSKVILLCHVYFSRMLSVSFKDTFPFMGLWIARSRPCLQLSAHCPCVLRYRNPSDWSLSIHRYIFMSIIYPSINQSIYIYI